MTSRLVKGAAVAALCSCFAHTALADPLSDLVDEGPVCYVRTYDKAHLDRHPLQTVTEVRLSLVEADDRDGAIIRALVKTKESPNYIVGGCNWTAKANLDINDKPIIEAFKGPSGLNCWALTTADGSSAEEGGDFPIDLKDGKSIYLYLPDYIAAWTSFDRSGAAAWLETGSDDGVFRLDRANAAPCAEMVDKLPRLL
jgi:hypothetical protein